MTRCHYYKDQSRSGKPSASFAVLLLCLVVTTAPAWSQSTSSTILGAVTDPQGNAVAGSNVTLISEGTGDQRSSQTDSTGSFVFPAVPPGSYIVTVASQGFQTYRKTGISLTASERFSLGSIQLQIGSITETITVAAQGATVQTASAESSAVLTTNQIENIAMRGRNVSGFLRLLPGVSTAAGDLESIHGGGIGTTLPNVGGVRNSALTIGMDGMQGQDNGTSSNYTTSASPDAVEEVKVLLNSYQAEYGRNGGAVVNVVTKSGTKDFHGTAYYYKRHEMFNATNFFNNAGGLSKERYRYNTYGFTLGGPVSIPTLFNKSRDKLFFFFNFEQNPSLEPQSITRNTMPTALERGGNFSQSIDQNGRQIVIRDPDTGAAFPGNVIPSTRVNKNGQALLNLFALPNRLDRNVTKGAYNYEYQDVRPFGRTTELFRIDYRPTAKDSIFFRGTLWDSWNSGFLLTGWEFVKTGNGFQNQHAAFGYTRIVNSNIVNELNLGVRRPHERNPAEGNTIPDSVLAKLNRTKVGFLAGQFNPEINPAGIIPQVSFGGVPSAPNFGSFNADRFPLFENDFNFNIADGLTINRRNHTFKVGIYAEKDRIITGNGFAALWMGQFTFNADTNNPLDTGNPYSNAALGTFQNYTQSTGRTIPAGTAINIDWYVQDSWKVTKRLTMEIGLRAAYYTPWYQWDGQQSALSLERYNPAKAPLLYRPTGTGSARRAINPLTGQTFPAALIGAFIPGTGDPSNGYVTTRDGKYPEGFYEKSGPLWQPRFGFAYDVFGNGKTAIRGGFGKFNQILRYEPRSALAPISYNPTIFYDKLDTFLNASGVLSPGSATSYDRYLKSPDIYNITLGVQQNVGFGAVVDVKYVSSLGRNLAETRNINTLPYGIRFLPQSLDVTTGRAFADNFLRPYPGYGDITYREASGSSNYHSLQVTANRRFARSLQFGVAYSFGKVMDYGTSLPQYRPYRVWNYGKADFDQTHILVMNYTYDLPRASRLLPSSFTRVALDNWQISGITTFASGVPLGIGLTTTNSVDLVGGGDGQRVNVTGDPRIAHRDRGILGFFKTSVFALPKQGDFGNAPRDVFRGPGNNNWDLTLFKNFPLKNEQRTFQFRWEFYNLLNHTQFTSIDTTARFDPATGAQTNGRFGLPTAARNPRLMQASLRFRF